MSGVEVGLKGLDLASQFHHCFWMGDMNYRVDLGTVEEFHHLAPGEGKDKKTLQKQKFEIVSDLVAKLDGPERETALATLHDADELSSAMAKKDVLVGFEELPGLPTFHPTFKVHRWEAEKYVVKRTPLVLRPNLGKELAWVQGQRGGNQLRGLPKIPQQRP